MPLNERLIDDIKELISLKLKDFRPDDPSTLDIRWEMKHTCYAIDSSDISIPSLVHFIFIDLLKFPSGERGEKTHWVVPFKYKNIHCSLALEKLGLFLYLEFDRIKSINYKEITGKIKRAILDIEKHLLIPIAKSQISNANVTISNKYYQLNAMYRYFRDQALNAFNLRKKIKKSFSTNDFSKNLNLMNRSEKEGSYNTFAMINAYFSLLEHMLVIFLPFSEYDRNKDNLVKFIGATWDIKFRRILGIEDGSESKIFYDKLSSIKEQFRNIVAHGGFAKKGTSLAFHFPIIGTLPVSLGVSSKNSKAFFMTTMDKATYIEICTVFDKFEYWLENTKMVNAFIFIKSGLNLPTDKNTLEEIKINSKNTENFKLWIEEKSIRMMMYENVEY